MRRGIIALVLLGLSAASFRAAQADGPRVVTERYQISPEVPNAVDCRVGGFVFIGFGASLVEFPVRTGERSVDILIDDDLHDNPVGALVTQAPEHYPEARGTWICGSKRGIPITTDAPVKGTCRSRSPPRRSRDPSGQPSPRASHPREIQ